MNCKTFMRKLPEFIENSMMHDMSEAMKRHMSDCNSCKTRFDEERAIDLAFNMALDIEGVSFNSCRADIMKNINKKKYSKNPLNKIRHGIKKFQIQIVSTAAIFLMTMVAAPYIMDRYEMKNSPRSNNQVSKAEQENLALAKDTSIMTEKTISDEALKENVRDNSNKTMAKDVKALSLLDKTNDIYVPEFTRVELELKEDLEFATDWTESPDKNLKVAIEGRGPDAIEEGVGKLVFVNNDTSKMWKLSLANNETKQFTPMKVSWFDNENLLVIFGYGQGRVTLGGDVILLNAHTGKAVNIYWEYSLDKKKQVAEASRNNEKIDLRVILYDDMVNNYKEEFRSIDFSELYNDSKNENKLQQMEGSKMVGGSFSSNEKLANNINSDLVVENIELLVSSVNDKNYESMASIFSEELLKEDDYLHLAQIQNMYLVRIINVSNSSREDGLTSTYYVETIMDMKEESNLYKSGTNYLSICVKKDLEGKLTITDIARLPQNQN